MSHGMVFTVQEPHKEPPTSSKALQGLVGSPEIITLGPPELDVLFLSCKAYGILIVPATRVVCPQESPLYRTSGLPPAMLYYEAQGS